MAVSYSKGIKISIHALLAESDICVIQLIESGFIFLSTLSLRRATDKDHYVDNRTGISIHALLAESDRQAGQQQQHHNISIHALLAESDFPHQNPEKSK